MLKLLKSKVFKNGIWLTVLQVVNTIIPVITIPYITRILGASEYGSFSIALNWVLYFQVLVEFGFGLSGARKVALLKDNEKKKLNELYNNIISSRILLFIISFIALGIIAFVSKFSLKIYLSMLILFIMIVGTTFQLTWLFQGKQDMKFITIINVVSRAVSVLLIFLFVKSPKSLYLYCFLYSITLLLSSIISNIIARRKYGLKFKFSKLKGIKQEINDGKYLFASSAMTKIFSGFGVTVLGIISSNSITGIYSAIYKIPYVLTMFFLPVTQAIYPYNSSLFKDNFNVALNKIKKICVPIFCVFLIPSILVIIFRNIAVNILFGKEYVRYSIIVIPLVIQFLFAMINNFLGIQILVASGRQKEYSRAMFVGCISIVVFNILLGNLYDIYGISIASAISEFVLTLLLFRNYKKNLKGDSND